MSVSAQEISSIIRRQLEQYGGAMPEARNLGTVSLIGPTRMDYATAIRSVRGAAALLSEFVEQVYE